MIPAVLLVLGVAIGGIHLAAQRVALASLAGEVARLEARGDAAAAAERIVAAAGTPEITRTQSGDVLCVAARSSPGRGLLGALRVSAESCAAVSYAVGEGEP